jgi:hypothetical protein
MSKQKLSTTAPGQEPVKRMKIKPKHDFYVLWKKGKRYDFVHCLHNPDGSINVFWFCDDIKVESSGSEEE